MKSTWPYKRYLKILCCSFFFAYAGICVCQCPNKDFIQKQLRDADKLYPIKNENPLGELLRLQQQLKLCGAIHDSTYMFLLQKIGKFYFKQSDFINAVHITNQSIVVARECLKINPANSLPIVDGYYNLHYYFNVMGDEEKKYDAIDSCIAYSLKGNIGFDKTIPVLQDKTSRLFNKGEYSACITNAELGISLMQQYHGDNSVAYMILFTDNLVNSLIFSADISTAEKILDRQKSFLEQTNNSKYLGEVYSFLGSINRDKRRYPEAVTYFKKANRAFGMIKYNSGYAKSLMNLGKLYAIAFNNTNKGLNFCEEAIKYAEGEDSLIILMETGNIYVQKKLYDKAQYFFQQAFNVVQHGMDETSMLKNTFQFPGFNQLQDLSDLATGKGDAFLQQYYDTKDEDYLKKALAVYRKNDFFLAKIKTEHQLQINSSLVWKATARNLYEHALDACYVNNNTEDAFYFFEKSRATLLDDQIKEQQWTNDADIAKLAAVKRTIIELQRKINSLPSSSVDYLPIQHKLYNSSEELTFLSHKLKTDNPVFYQHYVDTSFINLVQLRQDILGNSKSLVEIFSGDSSVYVLTVTPVNKKIIKINKQVYQQLVNSFNNFIINQDVLNKNFPEFVKTASQLYRLLFPDSSLPSSGSLIISPDGKSFPFEALVTAFNNGQPDYLLHRYATSYTYSAKYLINDYLPNTENSYTVLGMAPITYKAGTGLNELNGSDISLQKIKDLFPNTTNLLFEKASKKNFFEQFPSYTIVQLYTHASDSSADNDPIIYFADSSMLLSELVTDRKPITQLVVLSACETANGKLYEGEGIFSFNRGFAALGIPAAVSTLWSVENESTYKITELFYKYLAQELPTDIALQKAKLEFISTSSSKEKTLPYYWAGPILTGKVDTIITKKNTPWKTILLAGIALLAVAFIANKSLSKNTNRL